MTWPTESAGRWLEPCGNAWPRGMIVIARKRRNRIPLIGLLHTFSSPRPSPGAFRHFGVPPSPRGDETAIFAFL